MVLNPTMNIQNNGCGTISKCSGCMFKLICDKSPYCALKDNNNDSETYQNIQEQLTNIMSGLSTVNNNIMAVDINDQKIANAIDLLQTSVNLISENVNKLLSNTNAQLEALNENLANNTNGIINVSPSGSDVVPYTEENQDATVLVEKKNIFGKSKWVEKKI